MAAHLNALHEPPATYGANLNRKNGVCLVSTLRDGLQKRQGISRSSNLGIQLIGPMRRCCHDGTMWVTWWIGRCVRLRREKRGERWRGGYGLEYDGTNVEQLSPGARGIVLLLLYLAIDRHDRRPLLLSPIASLSDGRLRSVYIQGQIFISSRVVLSGYPFAQAALPQPDGLSSRFRDYP